PANSPDFNPIERIWTLIKQQNQTWRGSERITTVTSIKQVLKEEWDRVTIEKINKGISKLPTIMCCCLDVNGGNNYHV
ncbi:hypothetical protein K440DRAFT_537532, partial [Wilcoxina mikolae CBS 423.85]